MASQTQQKLRIVLIRHSRTVMDRKTPAVFWELSEEGRAQAYNLPGGDPDVHQIQSIWCSNQLKAGQTAMRIAASMMEFQARDVPVFSHFGLAESTSVTNDFLVNYEVAMEGWHNTAGARVNGGETVGEVRSRMKQTIDEIREAEIRRRGYHTVGVVSHGNALSCLTSVFRGASGYWHSRIAMPDVAVLEFDDEAKSYELVRAWGEEASIAEAANGP